MVISVEKNWYDGSEAINEALNQVKILKVLSSASDVTQM